MKTQVQLIINVKKLIHAKKNDDVICKGNEMFLKSYSIILNSRVSQFNNSKLIFEKL